MCFNHYIPETEILTQIKQYLDIRLPMVTETEDMLRELKRPRVMDRELSSIRRKMAEYEEKKERLWKDYADRILEADEYQYAKKKYDAAYQELSRREEELVSKEAERNQMVSEAVRWIESMKKYQKLRSLDRELIELLVQRIDVYGGRRLEIVMNYRDEQLEQCFRELSGKEHRHAG